MLHHGFLSPRSNLLANTASASLTPTPSPASTVFGNTDPLPRDTRDTPKRRVRHRDGKLLRGGIGLTTGLGWSDSETRTHQAHSLAASRASTSTAHSRSSASVASSFSILGGHPTQSEYAEDTGVWTNLIPLRGGTTRLARGASIRTDESAGSAMSLLLMRSHSRVLTPRPAAPAPSRESPTSCVHSLPGHLPRRPRLPCRPRLPHPPPPALVPAVLILLSSPSRVPFLDSRPPALSPALVYTTPHPRAHRRESYRLRGLAPASGENLARNRCVRAVCIHFRMCNSPGARAEPAQMRT
ncbi:hypothetical protein B0H16DRAFT_1846578 [Mycena metata]|uniref:Uncharacterized protein n=1 Tax=Mycena metata TaxID=1033252 RepID=A0AAD7NWQ6_9AGAR|nr:hypothetical protein B0H16DRAFT_1846578 [Mycena metata]